MYSFPASQQFCMLHLQLYGCTWDWTSKDHWNNAVEIINTAHSTAQSVHNHKQCTSLHSYEGWKAHYDSNVLAACYCSNQVASCLKSLLYSECSFCHCLIKLSVLKGCSVQEPLFIQSITLFPGARKKKNWPWYPLFTHAWLPRFFWGTLNYCDTSSCYMTIHYSLFVQQSCVMCPW